MGSPSHRDFTDFLFSNFPIPHEKNQFQKSEKNYMNFLKLKVFDRISSIKLGFSSGDQFVHRDFSKILNFSLRF